MIPKRNFSISKLGFSHLYNAGISLLGLLVFIILQVDPLHEENELFAFGIFSGMLFAIGGMIFSLNKINYTESMVFGLFGLLHMIGEYMLFGIQCDFVKLFSVLIIAFGITLPQITLYLKTKTNKNS
jgi:hypothetical protein